MKRVILLLGLLIATPVWAQIAVPDTIEPHMPIVAGCNCIIPENGEVQFLWRTDKNSRSIPVGTGKDQKLHVWAGPGQHEIEVTALVTTYQVFKVLVADPNDPSKEITKEMRLPTSFDFQQYQKTFKVTGVAPVPDDPVDPDDPDPPPPGPTPNDPFAKEAQGWLKAIPASAYSKTKALGVADNYDAIAAQAVATSTLPNLAAFSAAMKERNLATLGIDGVNSWRDPFFVPLANYQAKLAQERGVTATNVRELAKIYTETATAIRAAAF